METQTYIPVLISFLGLGLMGLIIKLSYQKAKLVVELSEMKLKYEKEITERNTKLFGQSRYSELGMMSAGIAHEINNPLAVIQARTTQLLRIYRDGKKTEEIGEGLQQILYTSERINRTIQGVREFVHQDDNSMNTDICLKDLMNDVLAFCGQRLKNHGVSLRFYNLERYHVRGNKIQLEQIFLNLINNSFDAIEFLPDKWIEMSVTETQDKSVHITFKDSGPGIPSEISAKMMEPFFTTKEIGKGTGLGLALARGIAEKHGGALAYVNDSNHTTFTLDLPKYSAELDWNSFH
jgi:C4-dicarboxylate-specific signal transduction histidine kinase